MKPSSLLYLTILFSLSLTISPFNIILPEPSTSLVSPKRCYTTTVYRQQRLLIQMELPILKPGLDLVLEVALRYLQKNKDKKIVLNETIKEMKYKKTVEKDSVHIHEIPSDVSLEYQTCLYFKSKSPISTTPNTNFETFLPSFIFGQQQKKINSESYLISLKLLTNFSHVLQDKRQQSTPKPKTHAYTKEHLEILQEKSTKLLAIAREQVKIHRENEKTEMKTEEHVKNLENSIYSMSLTQSALLVFGSMTHINLMRSYLKGTGLI